MLHECHVLLRHFVHADDGPADLIDPAGLFPFARDVADYGRRTANACDDFLDRCPALPAAVFSAWIFQGKRPTIGGYSLKDCIIDIGISLSRQDESLDDGIYVREPYNK